ADPERTGGPQAPDATPRGRTLTARLVSRGERCPRTIFRPHFPVVRRIPYSWAVCGPLLAVDARERVGARSATPQVEGGRSSFMSFEEQRMRVWPGHPYPLGATWDGAGVNFALFSEHA